MNFFYRIKFFLWSKWLSLAKFLSPLLFVMHSYPLSLFRPVDLKHNIHILNALRTGDALLATRRGDLRIAHSRWSVVSLGAHQARVRTVCWYSFLALTLEFNNPIDKRALLECIARKALLFDRLLAKIPLSRKGRAQCLQGVRLYFMASFVQLRLISHVHRAVHRQAHAQLVQRALESGVAPRQLLAGKSGSYLMYDSQHRPIAIFKPFDEEFLAPYNPVGFVGPLAQRAVRFSCRVGEGCHREVAASLVDELLGLGVVPQTVYARFASPHFSREKIGSLQAYMRGLTPLERTNSPLLDTIPLKQIQSLILLDIIIGNLDRHRHNILIAPGALVVIDHGLSFPDCVRDELSTWFWSLPPWADLPWNDELVHLILTLPVDILRRRLHHRALIEYEALVRMEERITLLQANMRAPLTPRSLVPLFSKKSLRRTSR